MEGHVDYWFWSFAIAVIPYQYSVPTAIQTEYLQQQYSVKTADPRLGAAMEM